LRTLAIDTSSEACSVALFVGEQLVDANHELIGRGHAEKLIPMIAALNDGGRADRILVGCGPGSFTGVRVGIAAARGLALGWQAQVSGFNSLALVAVALSDAEDLSIRTVVMDGGHGEWLVQRFAADGTALSDLASLPPERAIAGTAMLLIGNRAGDFARLAGAGLAHDALPDARHALRLAPAQMDWLPRPVYARAPDAATKA
jgi:tRNA threonylcarbamoyl adenosine modification protein YeaZ